MSLMHELEQLVDDSLQELPVGFEESGILTDNVHNVGSTDSLVVLASLHLSKTKEILDDSHKEALFSLLVCVKSAKGVKYNKTKNNTHS